MASLVTLAPYVAGTVAGILALVVLRRRHKQLLPPGPKPLPFIGNLLDLPKDKAWLTYHQWNERYGNVICVDALGQKIIILGSAAAVDDLIEKRGAVYSDRPVTTMMELTNHLWSFVVLPYGDLWRRKRKLMHSHIHQGVVDRYHPLQIASARRLAREILVATQNEDILPQAIRLNFSQIIIKAVYGLDVDSYESDYVSLPEKWLEISAQITTPGQFLVDVLPVLRHIPAWFPGAGFQRKVIDFLDLQRRTLDAPMEAVKAQLAEGTAPPSIAQSMLEEDGTPFDLVKEVTAVAYLAGSDTTVAAVLSFFLAMLVYPDVQAKAQAELDRVVGTDRLPELEDRQALPYVEGVINECLRWLPVLPMGVPHKTTQDDEYNGYFIPKGALVMGSVWGILHNPKDYPEPERFHPDRYLTSDGQLNPSVRDPRTACFGFGRRICPGRFFADTSLFITVATLLATVNVVRAKDEQGNEIVPEVDVTGGGLSHPKPFPWAVCARSPHAEDLLASVSV